MCRSFVVIILLSLTGFCSVHASRKIFLSPINGKMVSDFKLESTGLPPVLPDTVPNVGDALLAVSMYEISLQNISSNKDQSGTLTLSGISATFSQSSPTKKAIGVAEMCIKGGTTSSLPVAVHGSNPASTTTELSAAWTLPAGQSRRLVAYLVGTALYGTPATLPSINNSMSFGSLWLEATAYLTIDDNVGAILGTYTSNYYIGDSQVVCGKSYTGEAGYPQDRGGMNLTLLVNGGRPF